MSIIEMNEVGFSYDSRPVLKDLSLSFDKGCMYAILGRSGAGKTTLLSLLSGLATPQEGTILYDGKNIADMNTYEFRSSCVGVIFQGFNLLTKFTALENVMLAMDIAGLKESELEKQAKALELLHSVGLDDDEAGRRVLKLSGGQQQRVAIARALSYDPDVILADEPTGNLDAETQSEILRIFRNLANDGKCVILVTHSPEVAAWCDERYELARL